MSKRKVAYFYDSDVGAYTYGMGHLMKPHRMRITHELATAYGMLDKMHVLRPKRATPEQMSAFHTDEYINFLHNVTPETAEKMTFQKSRCEYISPDKLALAENLIFSIGGSLVGDDNPPFEGVFEFCSISAGGSISAAESLASGVAEIAINWAGGLHHAKKREAAGFCYINDIVLGILELLRTYTRVLYIDIDCHHGDGVEEAFYSTDRVMTCSFHKFGEFFPGTGTQEDIGADQGKGYSVNVPLKDGISDEAFKSVFDPIVAKILEVYQPSVVVLQCGADSLAGDKLGCLNLSMHGHAHCVQFLRKYNIPLKLLGGGGYTVRNVAKCWTYETACALGIEDEINPNLPWNQYFEWFGPTYRLEVPENNMEDLNVKDGSLDIVREVALEQLRDLNAAPSVQIQDVPRESLGEHLGYGKVRQSKDDLDGKLAQHSRYLYNLQDSESTDNSEESDNSDSDMSSSSANHWRHAPHRSSSASLVNKRYSSRPPYTSTSERRRMSIVSGKYFDIPIQDDDYGFYDYGGGPTKIVKRKFFSGETDIWDGGIDVQNMIHARMALTNVFDHGIHDLLVSDIMENEEHNSGDGEEEDDGAEEGEEGDDDGDDDDITMSVEP
ncbi:hypothetical protein CPB84DRAFT_1692299 [Gymnopilus junonius]|uniref:histone deacetylase n=1 Tax=Gymnopilus junonius TaxID=109634 RepID=A0A9P5N856_GYMJU|nr:hypothetical protein CPB84DRAFT_1692299 [Gymnopilus junonius]